MKKSFKLLVFILSSALIFSCGGGDNHSHDEEGHQHNHSDSDHKHENNEVSLPEEGGKWEANPETTKGIKAMQQRVDDFLAEDSKKDYALLKDDLEMEFQTIFQKCTMTGEAHEQLHNYLLPMKHLFEKLESEDKALRDEKLGELQDHLAEYSNYFK